MTKKSLSIYTNYVKPVLDFMIASFLFILFLPLFILIMILLAVVNNGKIFFTQERPGKGGYLFKVIKFKTMNDRKDANGFLLPDKYRLTTIGKFIRKTSLDEIPQLINVIKGDMSIVGPRPLLVEYLPLYNSFQRRRHEVKPGITGWAQVNGRNAISWQEKFNFDVWYVDKHSFYFDLKILVLTIKKVCISEGISAAGSDTMEKFKGNV